MVIRMALGEMALGEMALGEVGPSWWDKFMGRVGYGPI
jgi:hypothetical protein